MINELKKKLNEIEGEGRACREGIRNRFANFISDISHIDDSVHHQESGINQAGMATGESRSTSRKGTERAGKEKGKTTD